MHTSGTPGESWIAAWRHPDRKIVLDIPMPVVPRDPGRYTVLDIPRLQCVSGWQICDWWHEAQPFASCAVQRAKVCLLCIFFSWAGVVRKGAVGSAAWLRHRVHVCVLGRSIRNVCSLFGRVSCFKLYQHNVTSHAEELWSWSRASSVWKDSFTSGLVQTLCWHQGNTMQDWLIERYFQDLQMSTSDLRSQKVQVA